MRCNAALQLPTEHLSEIRIRLTGLKGSSDSYATEPEAQPERELETRRHRRVVIQPARKPGRGARRKVAALNKHGDVNAEGACGGADDDGGDGVVAGVAFARQATSDVFNLNMFAKTKSVLMSIARYHQNP